MPLRPGSGGFLLKFFRIIIQLWFLGHHGTAVTLIHKTYPSKRTFNSVWRHHDPITRGFNFLGSLLISVPKFRAFSGSSFR